MHLRKITRVPAALLLACALGCSTSGGPDQGVADDDPGASGSVGGPAHALSFAEARRTRPGTTIRLRSAVVLAHGRATACDSLAEVDPPRCSDGLTVEGFDRSTVPPGARTSDGVVYFSVLEMIVKRTAEGLERVPDPAS